MLIQTLNDIVLNLVYQLIQQTVGCSVRRQESKLNLTSHLFKRWPNDSYNFVIVDERAKGESRRNPNHEEISYMKKYFHHRLRHG